MHTYQKTICKGSILLLLLFISTNLFAQEGINQFDANGKRHGLWKKLYRNKNVRYTGKFEHGKEVGSFKYYRVTGEKQPIVIKDFTANNTIVAVRFYSKEGVFESHGEMEDKSRIGKWTYFFKDGKTILSTENYKNGLLDGELKIYYKSGKTAEVSHYKKGKLHGNITRYNEEGKPHENLTYKNGVMHGPAILYDKKGEVFAKGNYENGIKSGIWEFNMDGEMVKAEPDKIKRISKKN